MIERMHAQDAGAAGGFDEAADLGHRFLLCARAVFSAVLGAVLRAALLRVGLVLDGDRKKIA